MRPWFSAFSSIGVALTLASGALAAPLTVTPRNSINLGATATDQNAQNFTVTGMSGIVHRGGGQFAAVMDNSNHVVLINVAVNNDGSMASAVIGGGLTLSQSRDHEGIAIGTACDPSYFVSEEAGGPPVSPNIHEYDAANGALLRTIVPPAVFQQARGNFGFESLTRSPLGTVLWTANEEALTIDGPVSSPTNGTTVRLLRFGISGQGVEAVKQYAYLTQPMHGLAISNGRSGVADLVALPDGRLLVLERSFALSGSPFQCRIYEVSFVGATEVSGFGAGLTGQTYTNVTKSLLWSGNVANMEGLALGQPLPSGKWSLIGIVDDADPISLNTVVAFELGGVGARPEDVNADGMVRADDAYVWNVAPMDVNADGAVDSADERAVTGAARAVETCDTVAPER